MSHKTRQTTFEAIGTHWRISVDDAMSDSQWATLLKDLHSRIDAFDKNYSRFRTDSLVTKISQTAGTFDLPKDAYKMLQFYKELYDITDGGVTPLIGQTVSDAGYDSSYSLQSKTMHQPPNWEDVLTYTATKLTVSKPVLLDFGAAGKGYLIDLVGEVIAATGYSSFVINAGGDILFRTQAEDYLQVGLENPFNSDEVIGTIGIHNKSLCASAGSKRNWGRFHHIIDPKRLVSPQHVKATWVLADDAMTADGLATALYFTSPQALSIRYSFAYAILHQDMQLEASGNFPVRAFTEQS